MNVATFTSGFPAQRAEQGQFASRSGLGDELLPQPEPDSYVPLKHLPLGIARWYVGANYINAVKTYVDLLNANGIVAVLDLHWTDGLYTGRNMGRFSSGSRNYGKTAYRRSISISGVAFANAG